MNKKTYLSVFKLVIAVAFLGLTVSKAEAIDYYVDAVGGNDANAGTSQALAWKTIDKINNLDLNAGDSVNLKAGTSYTVIDNQTVLLLMPSDSGSATQPVTIRSYGTGAKPLLYQTYNSNRNSACLGFFGGVSNVVIDGLHLKGVASPPSSQGRNGLDVFSTALLMDNTYSNNVTIQNCEIEGGSRGLLLYNCTNFNILNNQFHDITGAITNTNDWPPLDPATNPVGYDNDAGAEVIDLNTYCENIYIAGNAVENCYYTSYDYGLDGNFIEVFGAHTKNIEVAYNIIDNCQGGTVEMGSYSGGTVETFRFHHNLVSEASTLYFIQRAGTFALTSVTGIEFDNNTFVQRVISDDNLRPWTIFDVNGVLTDATNVKVRNNIFYLKTGTKQYWMGSPTNTGSAIYGNDDTFTHTNNIYYKDPSAAGKYYFAITPDATETTTVNPNFTNLSGGDYTLASTSSAVDTGINLGFTRDLMGTPIYLGAGPDKGAYESTYGGTAKLTIAASTAGSQQAGNSKEQAYDANDATRWTNDGTLANAWIQFDLGSAKSVSQVRMMFENGHLYTYPIKIRVGDGTTFTDAFTGSSSIKAWKTFEDFSFAPVTGRYVRVQMTGPNSYGVNWFSIWETEVYESPLAAITASTAGSQLSGTTKEKSYDVSTATQWSSDSTMANSWIQLDLGVARSVKKVRLMFENGHLYTYPIKIRVGNGTTFTDVFTGSSSLKGYKAYQDFSFTATSGRYVRVQLTGANSQGANKLSLWEASVYRAP